MSYTPLIDESCGRRVQYWDHLTGRCAHPPHGSETEHIVEMVTPDLAGIRYDKLGDNMEECLGSSFANSEMFRIACTAIIFNREGGMLITKRAPHKKVWPGKWTVPGGGLQTDDFTALEPTHTGDTDQWYDVVQGCVKREVKEETALDIHNLWLVTDLAFIRPDNVPVVVLSYGADLLGPDVVTYDSDTVDHAWVDLRTAREFDLIDGIYHELELAAMAWGKKLVGLG